MSVVMGDSFLCSARQLKIHVRAMVGNSGGYSGELICNCCLTTLRGHTASDFGENDVIVHHDLSL